MPFFGQVVSDKGIQTNLKKVEVIQKWPIPTNITEVCSFLGFTYYYYKFIRKYAQVAKPLYILISGENVVRNEIQSDGIMSVMKLLTNLKSCTPGAPILTYADFKILFRLHTEASILSLEVHVEKDGVEKVVSYASQSISKSESKYPVHKLEFLCLKWAISVYMEVSIWTYFWYLYR